MNMTKRLEKLAIIAMALWVASLVLDPVLFAIAVALGGTESAMGMSMLDVMPISIKDVVASLVEIGVGIWLFKQAKRDGNSPFVWALFGFVFSITAVVLYLLCELLKELKERRPDNNQVDASSNSRASASA
jgi:hypothetical protein